MDLTPQPSLYAFPTRAPSSSYPTPSGSLSSSNDAAAAVHHTAQFSAHLDPSLRALEASTEYFHSHGMNSDTSVVDTSFAGFMVSEASMIQSIPARVPRLHHQPERRRDQPMDQLMSNAMTQHGGMNGEASNLQMSPTRPQFAMLALQPSTPHSASPFPRTQNVVMGSRAIALEGEAEVGRGGTLVNLHRTPIPPMSTSMPSITHTPITTSTPVKPPSSHFSTLKHIPHPPDLDQWRRRLFDVDGIIEMTEDEFSTYFPHVDNIYSHRSTQRYKRKPFVSHYWDCRLKGRPPGTPKSDDPGKKKRKRTARERDLCDVKIKITEYFSGAWEALGRDRGMDLDPDAEGEGDDVTMEKLLNVHHPMIHRGEILSDNVHGIINGAGHVNDVNSHQGMGPPTGGSVMSLDGLPGQRYYTIQRVNGNGANGKSDGVPGPHKHTLEESDRVKKNSVLRREAEWEKERRKLMVSSSFHRLSIEHRPSSQAFVEGSLN